MTPRRPGRREIGDKTPRFGDIQDLEDLRRELDHEKHLRDTIEWSNSELEQTVQELEEELEDLENAPVTPRNNVEEQLTPGKGGTVGELLMRLEAQLAVNHQLEQQRNWLERELEHVKSHGTGVFPDNMHLNMDSLSETELIRLVKHFERNRTNLQSTLKDFEWRLDKESKEYFRLSEIRDMYQAELRHYVRALERLRAQHIHNVRVSHAQNTNINATFPLSEPAMVHSAVLSRWGTEGPGIRANHRILDPKKGPIRKTVSVLPLPKIVPNKKSESDPKQRASSRKNRERSTKGGRPEKPSEGQKGNSGEGQKVNEPTKDEDDLEKTHEGKLTEPKDEENTAVVPKLEIPQPETPKAEISKPEAMIHPVAKMADEITPKLEKAPVETVTKMAEEIDPKLEKASVETEIVPNEEIDLVAPSTEIKNEHESEVKDQNKSTVAETEKVEENDAKVEKGDEKSDTVEAEKTEEGIAKAED